MNNYDEIDKRLLSLLRKDALQTSEKLAQQLFVSSATIRRRKKRLLRKGIRIVAASDPILRGVGLSVFLALDIESSSLDNAIHKLIEKDEVIWLSSTTGCYDIIALLEFESADKLYDFLHTDIQSMQGVKNSETFICLRLMKTRYSTA